MKLGKKPAQFDPNVPKLMSLNLHNNIPSISSDWQSISYWPMLLNDQIGNCTIAAVGHVIEYWNCIGHKSYPMMTDLEAEVFYRIIGKYDPNNPATDQGCVELHVLNYFLANGIMAASQLIKLNQFVYLAPNSLEEIKASIYHLGNAYLGYTLPGNALQTNLWTIDPTAKIAGGHAINCVGYDDSKALLYVVSWGKVVPVTYDFHLKYCEEAWALHSTDWLARN